MIKPEMTITSTELRFAYAPLVELSTSYRVLINPKLHTLYRHWVDEAYRSLNNIDLPHLDSLVSPMGNIPDFITPTPNSEKFDFEADIEHLRHTPIEKIQQDILEFMQCKVAKPDEGAMQYFLVNTQEAIDGLISELRVYWRRALMPYWTRMHSVLEGDVLYRARRMALQGRQAVFTDLHPTISYDDGIVVKKVKYENKLHVKEIPVNKNSMQLIPTIFSANNVYWQFEPDTTMLIYSARGGGLWQRKQDVDNNSLEIALGAGRASILQALETPSNTGELARKLHLTAGGVSQHLSRLKDAGLVEPHRNGKRVYYHLTNRGRQLVTLFSTGY